MDVSVRSARLDDALCIADLTTQLGYPASPVEIRDRLRFLIDSPGHDVLVFDVDGEAVAWIGLVVAYGLTDKPHAELIGFVVGEAHRSKGVGATLMNAAEDWARGKGCSVMSVRTNVIREDAHRFYERCGYMLAKVQHVYRKTLD